MITRPLVILGTGRIARALLQQLLGRADHLQQYYQLCLPILAASNSRFIVSGAPYLSHDETARIIAEGLNTGEPASHDLRFSQIELVRDLARTGHERAIVVDVTGADNTTDVLAAALDEGHDVVLANKKPLSHDFATFLRLTRHPRGQLSYEATVGAGLPIIGTLQTLMDAGDTLIDLTACLSGTLSYVCTELEDGRPLSQIVCEARERGFTEPDPREDLSGADVRRKALILARTLNLELDLEDIPDAPLLPLEEGSTEDWLAGLTHYDALFAERARAAHEQGDVLRYVARILPQKCEVAMLEVPRTSAVGRLRGTDNILTLRSQFYDERPLVISGPGAGPEVTAAGIFGDLVRLARRA